MNINPESILISFTDAERKSLTQAINVLNQLDAVMYQYNCTSVVDKQASMILTHGQITELANTLSKIQTDAHGITRIIS